MPRKSWKTVGKVEVQTRRGDRKSFDNLEDAVIAFWDKVPECKHGWIVVQPSTWQFEGCYSGDPVLFKDEDGLVVPPWKLREVYNRLPEPVYPHHRAKDFVFRRGPVKHINRRRWHRSPGPSTTQERREAVALEIDEDAVEYHILPRRGIDDLPNSLDDCGRNWLIRRSWKHYRKHQWKEN